MTHEEESYEAAYEAYLVVEGALEDTVWCDTRAEAERWVEAEILDRQRKRLAAEGYILDHYHAPGSECQCAQYADDTRPYMTTIVEEEEVRS